MSNELTMQKSERLEPNEWHHVRVASIEMKKTKAGDRTYLMLEFKSRDGRVLRTPTSSTMAVDNKTGEIIAAILGHMPEVGETFTFKDLVKKPLWIFVSTKTTEDSFGEVKTFTEAQKFSHTDPNEEAEAEVEAKFLITDNDDDGWGE